jgi:hypothetical protein
MNAPIELGCTRCDGPSARLTIFNGGGVDHLREIAAQADPAKVNRMLAHVDAQAAALPKK